MDAILHIEGIAGAKRRAPGFECWRKVIGMDGADPTCTKRLLHSEAGESPPALAGVEDGAIGFGGPGNLGVEFDCVAIMVFALAQSFFLLFDRGDIGDGTQTPRISLASSRTG